MLDPPLAVVEGVEEVGDVAGGVHVGHVGLESLVDDDAVVDARARCPRESRVRCDADTDDGELGFDAEAALGLDLLSLSLPPKPATSFSSSNSTPCSR